MFLDHIQAVTTTQSNDTLTLSRAPGAPSWPDILGGSGEFVVDYAISQAVSRKRERGVGIVNCTSHTLQRIFVERNWNGTVYNVDNATPLDFGGYEAAVRCAPSPGHATGRMPFTCAASQSGNSNQQNVFHTTTVIGFSGTMAPLVAYYVPYLHTSPGPVIGWGMRGSWPAVAPPPIVYQYGCIHAVNTNGLPGVRLNIFDNPLVFANDSGDKIAINSSWLAYAPGWYWLGFLCPTSADFRPNNTSPKTFGPAPGVSYMRHSVNSFADFPAGTIQVNTYQPVIFLVTSVGVKT